MKCFSTLPFLFTCLLLIHSPVYGQDSLAQADQSWRVSFTPYFFAPKVDTRSTVDGGTVKLDLSFSDILDDFDVFGLSGRVEMWKDDWGLFFDGAYLDLEGDFKIATPAPTVNVGVDIEDAMLDFGVACKLYEVPLEDSSNRLFTFEPLGGLRYHYLQQEIKLKTTHPVLGSAGTTLGGDEEWVEPFVGARLKYDLTENLAAKVRADFGGFGIGSASDLTWNLVAGIDWQFKETWTLLLGYRVTDIDYSRYSGSKEFGFDGKLQGPIIGLTILF
jgi:opacity protein-like surface antigen